MQVSFPLEIEQRVITVPPEVLQHFKALCEASTECIECQEASLKSSTLELLCELAVAIPTPAELAHSLSLDTVAELVKAHSVLVYSDTLRDLLYDALVAVLQDYDNETMTILCDVIIPEEAEEEEAQTWFLSSAQAKIRNPGFIHRLSLLFYALVSLVGDRFMAAQCLARVPLPHTQLERMCETIGMSSYFARVVYEFVIAERVHPKLLYIVCTNSNLVVVNAALFVGTERERMGPSKLLKSLLSDQDTVLKKALKRDQITGVERDALMVHLFLGWAMTETGHVIYVYYRGPSGRRPIDMAQLENWAPVPVDLLRFFHTRLGKDLSPLYRLNSSDVLESGDGHRNPQLDVRYLAYKWAKKNETSGSRHAIENHAFLFSPGTESLVARLPSPA